MVVRWQVERLGGEVRQGNAFDSSCTHVIVAKDQLRRTEKVLGALASGKPLLSEEFLEASDRAGAFVAEQRYECRGAWPELLPIRRAPGFAHVRAAVLSDVRPLFHGASAQVAQNVEAWSVQVHEKRVGLERILRAGGAQIVTLGAAEAAGPPLTHVLVANGHGGEGMAAGDARIWRKMQREHAERTASDTQLVQFLTSGSAGPFAR